MGPSTGAGPCGGCPADPMIPKAMSAPAHAPIAMLVSIGYRAHLVSVGCGRAALESCGGTGDVLTRAGYPESGMRFRRSRQADRRALIADNAIGGVAWRMSCYVRIDRRYNQPFRLTGSGCLAVVKWSGIFLVWLVAGAGLAA
jgi:hypothetical protein